MWSPAIPCAWGVWNWNGSNVLVGLVGGTFDPIHLGHLLVAEEARVRLGLEEVVFIPTGQPWMKAERDLSPTHHRLNMVRLAVASNPFFRASSLEIDRPGLTYTIDTLREFHRDASGRDDFYFILGIDSLKEFHRWREPAKILELCTLVAVPRPGHPDMDLSFMDDVQPSASKKVVALDGLAIGISGTEIRRRVGLGLSVRYQVPEDVERYMYRYGLYRDAEVGK